jgi:clan AA aspartic protease
VNGRVVGRQPRLNVTFILPNRPRLEIEFVVDTGFDGFLMLPPEAVAALSLPIFQRIEANLADGTNRRAALHTARILWEGEEREVQVLALGTRPLLGTLLMDARELVVRFVDNGLVSLNMLLTSVDASGTPNRLP